MRTCGRWIAVFVLVLPLGAATPAAVGRAQTLAIEPLPSAAEHVPPAVEAAIIVRVVTSDGAFVARAGTPLTIGLVFRPGAPSSANLAALEAYSGLASQQGETTAVRAAYRAFRDRTDLDEWVQREGVDVLRVAQGLDVEAAQIRAVCDARKVVCASPEPDLLKQGFALAVVLRDAKPKLLVNLVAVRAQGLEPAARVLQRAELVP